MAVGREIFTATLLTDGTVLVVGGSVGPMQGLLASTELFDPNVGSWRGIGSLNKSRFLHTATLLIDGDVLVAGGSLGFAPLSSVEVYDPG
jgi:hypothetical protein